MSESRPNGEWNGIPGIPSVAVTTTWPTQRPQRQDSLVDQLRDLHRLAARFGMYDAADWLWKRMLEARVAANTPKETPGQTASPTVSLPMTERL